MSCKEFFDEMKKIQTNLLDFLEHDNNSEEKYQILLNIFDVIKIHENRYKIKPFLYLISKISQNHYRIPEFFSKIEKILRLFKDDMKKYFPNDELFHIFKTNKRLLLFLLEENIMIMNEPIVKEIVKKDIYIESKYPQYFQPEIQPFINEEWFPKSYLRRNQLVEDLKKELPYDFYEKRKIGENDDEIYKLIQKDLIEEFIIYVNQNNYPVDSTIDPSIYETNNFLIKRYDITLIEYAAFFGSIQIFNYLKQNGAELGPSLWLYAVHGHNPEIIQIIEENQIKPEDGDISYEEIFEESIKCHHIDVANYIQVNYLQNKNENPDFILNSLKYYNFMFIQCDFENESLFFYLCKYDYYLLAFIHLYEIDIDINKKLIAKIISFYKIQNYIFS